MHANESRSALDVHADTARALIECNVDAKNNLLRVKYPVRVTAEAVRRHLAELDGVLAGLSDQFVVLTDLSVLERMDPACISELSAVMDKLAEHRVCAVVRIIPDPSKDIGFNILSMFHYSPDVRIVTCADAAEAAAYLY